MGLGARGQRADMRQRIGALLHEAEAAVRSGEDPANVFARLEAMGVSVSKSEAATSASTAMVFGHTRTREHRAKKTTVQPKMGALAVLNAQQRSVVQDARRKKEAAHGPACDLAFDSVLHLIDAGGSTAEVAEAARILQSAWLTTGRERTGGRLAILEADVFLHAGDAHEARLAFGRAGPRTAWVGGDDLDWRPDIDLRGCALKLNFDVADLKKHEFVPVSRNATARVLLKIAEDRMRDAQGVALVLHTELAAGKRNCPEAEALHERLADLLKDVEPLVAVARGDVHTYRVDVEAADAVRRAEAESRAQAGLEAAEYARLLAEEEAAARLATENARIAAIEAKRKAEHEASYAAVTPRPRPTHPSPGTPRGNRRWGKSYV